MTGNWALICDNETAPARIKRLHHKTVRVQLKNGNGDSA